MFSISWNELLERNDIETFVKANNLDFDVEALDERKVGVFHKSKIYFNKNCKDYKRTYDQTFQNFGSAVNYENIFIILTVSVVLNSCAIIMLLVQFLIGCLLKNGKLVRNYTINWKMLVKSLSAVAIFDLLMITLLFIAMFSIKQNKNHIYIEAKEQGYSCVDKNLSLFIDFFLNKDATIFDTIILSLSFGIISSFSYIIFYLIIIKNFDKNQQFPIIPKNTDLKFQNNKINCNSAEDIQKISKTSSSTNSKYSQKSRDENYQKYNKLNFSSQNTMSGYVSNENITWASFKDQSKSQLNKTKQENMEEEKMEYVQIDENEEYLENSKDESSLSRIPELDHGLSQFLFKKEDSKNYFLEYKSNSLSDINRSKEFKNFQNEDMEKFNFSKYSSGEGTKGFGLTKMCPEIMKQLSGKNVSTGNITNYEENDSYLNSNNTSINQANINFLENNILNMTKEEISEKFGSIEKLKNKKTSTNSM